MMKVRNLGRKSLEEVLAKLKELGLQLKSKVKNNKTGGVVMPECDNKVNIYGLWFEMPRINKHSAAVSPKSMTSVTNGGKLKWQNIENLGRTSSQRKALIRNQVTALLIMERSLQQKQRLKKSVRSLKVLSLAVKEKDNFEEVTVTAKVARKDADGKRVKEVVDGKKVTVYDEVEKKSKRICLPDFMLEDRC